MLIFLFLVKGNRIQGAVHKLPELQCGEFLGFSNIPNNTTRIKAAMEIQKEYVARIFAVQAIWG